MSEFSLSYAEEVPGAQQPTSRHRAAALPPHERRAAIINATLPLLVAHGPELTTRQIAEAAGIAEGTIFRVFPDKDSLIAAVIEQATDPAPVDAALRTIDRSLPLTARLELAVEILQERFVEVGRLLMAVGTTNAPNRRTGYGKPAPSAVEALAEVFLPDQVQLRREPLQAAQLLRGLSFAGVHPALAEEPLTPAEVVSVFLDGIRVRTDSPC